MNQAIADIIKGHIQNMDFVDKIAGLTSVLTFDMKGKDNEVVQKSFPVACCVTPDECEKNGAYNDLMPNSEYKTVIYFEDGGVSFEKAESNWKYYKSSLRLVAWLNIEKLTESGICKSEIPCTYAAHIITEIIRALPEFPENTHGPIERVYSEITSQIVRNPSIFSAYTYDEKHVQYLMAPFDYFALTIETSFAICLSSRVTPDSTCVPEVIPVPIPVILLNVPESFSVTVISDTQIDLAHLLNVEGSAVIIERSLNGNDFTEIHRTVAWVDDYSDTGLITLTRYYYRIKAFDGVSYSIYTAVEDATTTAVVIDPVPATVRDVTKTVAWYAYDSHVVKDASNFVYKWEDNNGTLKDLIQAAGTNQPLWSADGVLFDGIDNFMKALTFVYDQPEFIYAVIKQVTWTINDRIWDGNANGLGELRQTSATPRIYPYTTGGSIAFNADLAVNTWGIVRLLFNGANSKFQIDNTAATTGNVGATAMSGFTLGASGGNNNWSNIKVKEIILRNVDDTGADEVLIYNYLATKYGLPTI